jgi:hypothetical protein
VPGKRQLIVPTSPGLVMAASVDNCSVLIRLRRRSTTKEEAKDCPCPSCQGSAQWGAERSWERGGGRR